MGSQSLAFSNTRKMPGFASSRAGVRALHLPAPYARISATEDWTILAHCAEFPGVVARRGEAVFTFDPTLVINRHLDMNEPEITGDLVDLIVRAVLSARGAEAELDADDLRRDFHALGISFALVAE